MSRGSLKVDWSEIIRRVTQDARMSGSEIHGTDHWRAVAAAGMRLCQMTPGADRQTVLLFGLLHDSMRANDGGDPEHGKRASSYIQELADEGVICGPAPAIERLAYACAYHNDGFVERDDPTIGVCWDADRLNLWRIGIEPAPRLLCTPAARDPEVIAWAQTLHETAPSWEAVIDPAFDPLSVGGPGELPELGWDYGDEDEREECDEAPAFRRCVG